MKNPFEQPSINNEEAASEASKKEPELLSETQPEGQEDILIPEQALEEEKGVLAKFERLGGGKVKRIVASLMLCSALVAGAGAFREASAADLRTGTKPFVENPAKQAIIQHLKNIEAQQQRRQKETAAQAEKEKLGMEIAADLLGHLAAMPDKPGVANPAQQYILKQEAAKTIIQLYAIQRKLGFPHGRNMDEILSGAVTTRDFEEGRITIADVKGALGDLSAAFKLFADKKFGDQDGETSIEEFEKMRQELAADPDNPGLTTFREMQREYFKPDNLRNTE